MPDNGDRPAAELLAESLRAELDRLHSMAGLLELMDEHWPTDIFPVEGDREDRDPGPRILSLARRLARAEQALAAAEALADKWAAARDYPIKSDAYLAEFAIETARLHDRDCPVWCGECLQWEAPRSCKPCAGSGCGPGTASGAYDPCDECGGDGLDHQPWPAEAALRASQGGAA